jgi:hypothetical protein
MNPLALLFNLFTAMANVALNKPSFQSYNGDSVSGRAVDGDTNSAWSGQTCTHTDADTNPWLRGAKWDRLIMCTKPDKIEFYTTKINSVAQNPMM